ncbi:hypothetical protein FA13DRAFT_1738967, partial [Coprinellus micaceus]
MAKWYLRSLNLGTNSEELDIVDKPFRFPQGTTEEHVYRALLLVRTYSFYAAKVKKERPVDTQSGVDGSRTYHAPTEHPAALDLVPLALIFHVALGLALEWHLMLTHGSESPASINWKRFGFPDPVMEPHRCTRHGRPYSNLPPNAIPAYPSNILPCGPEVCTHAMRELYTVFRDVIDTTHWSSIDKMALGKFKNYLGHRKRLSNVCTAYLRTLDIGSMTRMAHPWESVQVIMAGGDYPTQVYFAALYVLKTYRESVDFDRNTLDGVPLDWIFYAAILIAGDVLSDTPYTTSAVLANLGFCHPIESQTKRWVCPSHGFLKQQRDQEDEHVVGQKRLGVMTVRERRTLRKERQVIREAVDREMAELQGREVEVCPGPITSGMGPISYMLCDGVFPCIDGILRLRDYMLAQAFKWNLSFQTDTKGFADFERYMAGQL